MSSDTPQTYEDYLRRAHSHGWRDPIEITNLEIKAYQAGVNMERNRVLSIFNGLKDEPSMRIIDLERYLYRIRNPNNTV